MKLSAFPLCVFAFASCHSAPAEEEAVEVEAAVQEPGPAPDGQIGGLSPRQIVALFGARLADGVGERELSSYRRVFGFGDRDGDGRHSRREYIDEGVYMTRQARQGIFQAADSDDDGFVTRAEYVENRIITDEAKRIFEQVDADQDGRLTAEELVGSGRLEDEALAREVFEALDTNRDGRLILPEYLRVWGRWARS